MLLPNYGVIHECRPASKLLRNEVVRRCLPSMNISSGHESSTLPSSGFKLWSCQLVARTLLYVKRTFFLKTFLVCCSCNKCGRWDSYNWTNTGLDQITRSSYAPHNDEQWTLYARRHWRVHRVPITGYICFEQIRRIERCLVKGGDVLLIWRIATEAVPGE